ncbi:alpha/beta fold hydrolase [Streptomyces sp. NPDC006551]|uniref:esterase/lipase family protein n=1 Tax=Streptomyces sp. NPDC006551 TaxID=3157178 RepID=UPI0033AEBF63
MTSTHGQLGVVFVHGFNAGPDTWNKFVELIESDPDLSFVAPLPFKYATSLVSLHPLRRLPTIDTIADSLRTFLETKASDFQALALVSHSQGGLVIQRYLARMLGKGLGKDLSRIRRIVMFACPNTGSDLALALRKLLPSNPQELELRPFTESINDAQSIVINQIVNAQALSGSTCPIPIAVYVGEEDKIVPPASARAVFKDAGALPGDHSSIVRPDSHQHRSYAALKHALEEAKAPPTETLQTLTAEMLEVHTSALPSRSPDSIEALTPYLARGHDAALRQVLTPALDNGPSVLAVLTGESSTGKTRALYEALRDLAPTRPLLRPATAEDLLDLIEGRQIRSGTVV